MKKLFIISLLLVGTFSFSQEKKKVSTKKIDQTVTQKMDSLSKLYKVKVIGSYKITHNNVYVEGIVYEDESGNVLDKETKRIKIK
jgi:hypothetical protein